MRIAAFGFRSIPMRPGCAGADKYALELLPRLVARGHQVTAYNRLYRGEAPLASEYEGVRLRHIKTVSKKGFDTLLHSFRATLDIILKNTADVVHIQNGGNSIFAVALRLAGKKVFLSEDGVEWKRDKWPWYGKLYLYLCTHLTAFVPNQVIIDNVFLKRAFEERFRKKFEFIPFGCEVGPAEGDDRLILAEFGLEPGGYFLFVGRFIPDKGLQYLVPAFEKTASNKKLVLVGGSPHPSEFEKRIKSSTDPRINYLGFVYGTKTHALMRNAYAYVQPSDLEGLSPVVLENMGMRTPIICSDIQENVYVVGDTAVLFTKGSIPDCQAKLEYALGHPEVLADNAKRAKERAYTLFSWDAVADAHIAVFSGKDSGYA